MKRRTEHVREVIVNISGRDLQFLDDCDDMVGELMDRAGSVQLTFAHTDLAWVREQIAGNISCWGTLHGDPSDVALDERTEQGQTTIALNHKRGLGLPDMDGSHLLATFTSTRSKIAKVLGPPTNSKPSDDGKVTTEWILKTPSRLNVSVYDYKGSALRNEWQIGGFKPEAALEISKLLDVPVRAR